MTDIAICISSREERSFFSGCNMRRGSSVYGILWYGMTPFMVLLIGTFLTFTALKEKRHCLTRITMMR